MRKCRRHRGESGNDTSGKKKVEDLSAQKTKSSVFQMANLNGESNKKNEQFACEQAHTAEFAEETKIQVEDRMGVDSKEIELMKE